MPPRRPPIANDNLPDRKPRRRFAWDIYRVAARARWLGQVVAHSADEAVEAAAVEFKTDAWKLIAVYAPPRNAPPVAVFSSHEERNTGQGSTGAFRE
jgi:hypothetical protein